MGNCVELCETWRATRLYGLPLDLVCGKRRLHFPLWLCVCICCFYCLLVANSGKKRALSWLAGWSCGHLWCSVPVVCPMPDVRSPLWHCSGQRQRQWRVQKTPTCHIEWQDAGGSPLPRQCAAANWKFIHVKRAGKVARAHNQNVEEEKKFDQLGL